MEINLTTRTGEAYSVLVNGKLVCDGVADTVEDGSHLTALVRAARADGALRRIVQATINEARRCDGIAAEKMRPEAKRDAYARGLRDGLIGATVPHTLPGVPLCEPEDSTPYRSGYESGEAIRRAATMAQVLDR
jgi:hypothetical protein